MSTQSTEGVKGNTWAEWKTPGIRFYPSQPPPKFRGGVKNFSP